MLPPNLVLGKTNPVDPGASGVDRGLGSRRFGFRGLGSRRFGFRGLGSRRFGFRGLGFRRFVHAAQMKGP